MVIKQIPMDFYGNQMIEMISTKSYPLATPARFRCRGPVGSCGNDWLKDGIAILSHGRTIKNQCLIRYLTNTDGILPVSIVVGRLVKCRKITVQRLPISAIRCPDLDDATGQKYIEQSDPVPNPNSRV